MPLYILDPTGSDEVHATSLAPRGGVLAGKRVGLLANGKTNSVALLTAIGGLLVERYGAAALTMVDKGDATRPASEAVLQELIPQADVVVTAIGD